MSDISEWIIWYYLSSYYLCLLVIRRYLYMTNLAGNNKLRVARLILLIWQGLPTDWCLLLTVWQIYLQINKYYNAKQLALTYQTNQQISINAVQNRCKSCVKRPSSTSNVHGLVVRWHFVYVPCQWEIILQCNVNSHWLGPKQNDSWVILCFSLWFLSHIKMIHPKLQMFHSKHNKMCNIVT